jgi:hypothetical protein
MRCCRWVAIGLALGVAATAAAFAKEPPEGRVCGRSGCKALTQEQLHAVTSWWSDPFSQRRQPRPAPFFRIVVEYEAPDGRKPIRWTLVYVPEHEAIRVAQNRVPPYATGIGPYWRTVPESARAGLARTVAGVTPYLPSPSWHTCTPTVARPPAPDPALPSFNYGNATIRVALVPANGRIVAGRLPGGGTRATINDDGSIDAKFGWWRAGNGKIRITGRRVDAPAPPLRAHVPDGYGTGFQATGLTFPTTGCWRVTGRYAGAAVTFTVLVTKSRLGP